MNRIQRRYYLMKWWLRLRKPAWWPLSRRQRRERTRILSAPGTPEESETT